MASLHSRKTVETEYGEVEIDIAEVKKNSIVFVARHGKEHETLPHRINYRANLKALQKLGVQHIFATAAVGSISDFLDMTKQRPLTFFEGGLEGAKHVNMDDHYCANLRKYLLETAKIHDVQFKGNAIYICTEGPPF